MLTQKIRVTKIELIPYYTYFFFMTQNRISNIVNIEKYKNRIDLWGNFSVVLADQLYFIFLIILSSFSSRTWSYRSSFFKQPVLEMDKHTVHSPHPQTVHYPFNETTKPREKKAEESVQQTWLLPISFAPRWYMAEEEEFLTTSLLQV